LSAEETNAHEQQTTSQAEHDRYLEGLRESAQPLLTIP